MFLSNNKEWNKYIKDTWELLRYKSNQSLSHYTSPQNFASILEKNKLRFTDSNYLNDYSEGQYIYDLIQECLKDTKYPRDFCIIIEEEILSHSQEYNTNLNNYRILNKSPRLYIFSFSTDNDSLPMWNYYTKTTDSLGYNIAFSSKIISDIHNQLKHFANCHFLKVIYDKDKQIEIIKGALDIAYNNWRDNKKNMTEGDIFNDWTGFSLNSFFSQIRFAIKHPAFESEKEVRIVLHMNRDEFDKIIIQPANECDLNISFRENRGIFIPYVELYFSKENVKSIRVSPTINNTKIINSVEMLLKKYGYSCDVKKSDIPFTNY